MAAANNTPVLGFSAPSGTGKTTLLEGVIRSLAGMGLRVAALKHGHHAADPDTPGKDSHRFRVAGAKSVLFSGPERWFLVREEAEPDLSRHLALLAPDHDLILVESYRSGHFPKILVHRKEKGAPRFPEGAPPLAIASDDPELAASCPVLPLNDPDAVARFVVAALSLSLP